MRLPCSMDRMPASIARFTARAVYAWAATYRFAAAASSTTATSSSIEYWTESIRSVGDATPPDAITLMWWAPLRSSSRAAARTASTPSASRQSMLCATGLSSPGPRPSPCPPVWLSARPPKYSRGPLIRPSACALARP